MKARDLVAETLSGLNANRGRSLLTVLGIVIGISAVIAMTALIGGIKQSMIGQLGLNQARLVYIYCWPDRGMTLADVDAMSEGMSEDYEYITPAIYGYTEITNGTEKKNASIQGVLDNYQDAMGFKLVKGRFFNEREADSGALVVVLDQSGVKALFGNADEDVVGKTVRMNGAEYAILGVIESTDVMTNQDTIQLYMPFMTCANRINGWVNVDQVFGFAREGTDMSTLAERTRAWLVKYFNIAEDKAEEQVWIQTMASVIEELNTTMLAFQVLMTSVASISLVVGGIGIMNMMLTNVTERIREIGLRKALGAKARDITRQFLLESICLTLVGGIIGIVVGYFGAYAFTGLAGGMLFGDGQTTVTPYIDLSSILTVAGICVAIGIVFGYYPARRAAKLNPVESLHYQ